MRRKGICVVALVTLALGGLESWAQLQVRSAAGTPFEVGKGPHLGYVPGGTDAEVRPVRGVPGSAELGNPTSLPARVALVALAPRRDFGLGLDRESGRLGMVRIGSLPAEAELVPLRLERRLRADAIVFSPRGTAAVLHSSTERSFLIVRGLPDSPEVSAPMSYAAFPEEVTAIAVSDDGGALLAATADGSVYAAGSGEPVRFLLPLGRITAISFLGGLREAVIADGDRNSIYRLADPAAPGGLRLLAGEVDGVDSPVAVGVSRDNRSLVVANAGGDILRLDTEGGADRVQCNCVITGLRPLAGNAVFLVTDGRTGPLWLFDGDAEPPRARIVARGRAQ